jgi:hypothetical protein
VNKRFFLMIAFCFVGFLSGMEGETPIQREMRQTQEGYSNVLDWFLKSQRGEFQTTASTINFEVLRGNLFDQYRRLHIQGNAFSASRGPVDGMRFRTKLNGAILLGRSWEMILEDWQYVELIEEEKERKFKPCSLCDLGALHIAAVVGRADIVEGLLEYGVPYDIKDLYGKTPLEAVAMMRFQMSTESARPFAARVGNWDEIFNMLCDKAGLVAEDYEAAFRESVLKSRCEAAAAELSEEEKAEAARAEKMWMEQLARERAERERERRSISKGGSCCRAESEGRQKRGKKKRSSEKARRRSENVG